MGNPNLRSGADRWKMYPRYKHGVVQGDAQMQAIAEDERRREELDQAPPEKKPIFANKAPAAPGPIPDNTGTTNDRFHKWGSTYVTVANLHFAGDDPVNDPGAYHTITDGYAFAKTLKARMTNDEHVVVWVSGGQYIEDLVLDEPGIDVVGIGRPEIQGHIYKDPENNDFLFDNFKVVNPDTPEDEPVINYCGLYLDANNANSGDHFSGIQIRNCWFEGPKMQVHLRCWADFYNCDFVSTDNLTSGVPSVQCIWVQEQTGSFPPVFSVEQRKWTQFRNCRFNGAADPGGYLGPTYFRKGYALEISCVNPDTGDWASNVLTEQSGVYLKDCKVSGYSTNYGWNLVHDHCRGIEGYLVTETGTAGSVHHLAYSYSTGIEGPHVDPSTWFIHCVVNCRYVCCGIDVGPSPGFSITNFYLDHLSRRGADHATPPIVAGSDVIDGTNLVPPLGLPVVLAYANNYSTPSNFVYGLGGIENGILSNVTVIANNNIFTDIWEDV